MALQPRAAPVPDRVTGSDHRADNHRDTGPPRTSRTRQVLSVLAVAGALPYVTLKLMWLGGSTVGVVDTGLAAAPGARAATATTLAMALVAVVLALAFVSPWGGRLPAMLVLLPMWVGTGLLAPILVVLPVHLLLGSSSAGAGTIDTRSPLADWVYAVVYAGFAWQGLFLLSGFALYVRWRWGRSFAWRHPLGTWTGTRPRSVELPWVAAAAVLLVSATLALATHLSGVMQSPVTTVVVDAALTALAAAGLVALALGRPARLPRWVPVAGIWVGSGATTVWSGYLLILSGLDTGLGASGPMSALDVNAEAVRLVAGLTAATVGLWLVHHRRAVVAGARVRRGVALAR